MKLHASCAAQTTALQDCMHEHSDYYRDILYEQDGQQPAEAIQDEILGHEHKAIEGVLHCRAEQCRAV